VAETCKNRLGQITSSNPRMMEENVAGSSPWPILVGLLLSVLSFSHAGTLAAHGMREREVYTIDHEEDDDGFIEDNYISSGEKQKVATDTEEEEVLDTDSDDDLDIHFSIE
uniref:Uncharacterized protein n=1 Tax=Astyanax mexicanus TaxID=7994 RepID=A0A3B1J2E8_ASTMX